MCLGECFLSQYKRYHCALYGILTQTLIKPRFINTEVGIFDIDNYGRLRRKLSNPDWNNTYHQPDIDSRVTKSVLSLFPVTLLSKARCN